MEMNTIETIKPFMSETQMTALIDAIAVEKSKGWGAAQGKRYFAGDLAKSIKAMPATDKQRCNLDDMIVYLHYTLGGSNWYITERGAGMMATCFAVLEGLEDCAELGYVDIRELHEVGAELLMYTTIRTLAKAKKAAKATITAKAKKAKKAKQDAKAKPTAKPAHDAAHKEVVSKWVDDHVTFQFASNMGDNSAIEKAFKDSIKAKLLSDPSNS